VLDNIRGSWKTSKGTSRSALRGPWQTGEGNKGAPTGVGNGDTWLNSDGVHPSTPVGITGLAEVLTSELRAALASMYAALETEAARARCGGLASGSRGPPNRFRRSDHIPQEKSLLSFG
jgi:hypothetical protein